MSIISYHKNKYTLAEHNRLGIMGIDTEEETSHEKEHVLTNLYRDWIENI